MNKKLKLVYPLILVILIMSLVSCESLFTTNLFGDLDKLDLSNMSTREKAGTVLSDPEGAIEGLSTAQVNTLVTDLMALANDGSQPETAQMQAAAAASAVVMSASGADGTINNLGDMATSLVDGSLVIDSPDDILTAIFSDENGNPLSEAQILAQLTAMQTATTALEAYGDVLGADGNPPAGVDPDVLGVTALVSGLVSAATSGATTLGQLATAISDPASAGTAFDDLPIMDDLASDPANELFSTNSGLSNAVTGSDMISSLLDMMTQS